MKPSASVTPKRWRWRAIMRLTVDRAVKEVEIEGRLMFIEARVTATASGRPRVAH